MAYSYTRQSTISDGDTITAALFNNEYNQLLNSFAYSSSDAAVTGHRHDGSSAQGGSIFRIGDLDFLNKIEADSTNNRWGFYVQVSSSAVEQVRIQDGAIVPVTDNDIDLGTSSLEFKDAYFDGTVTSDAFAGPLTGDVTGNVSGTAATVTTAAQSNITSLGTLTTLTVDNIIINGTTIGHTSDTDLITLASGVATVAGELSVTTLDIGGTNVTSTAAELNILNGVTSTAAELNALDGITAVVGELNALDLGSTAVGTAIASKAVILDSNKDYTGVRNLTLTGDLTIGGDDLTMGTNTAGHLLIADGTNFNPVAVGSLSEISTVATDDVLIAVDTSGGGLKKITRSTLVAGLATSGAISNVSEDSSPQLGGNLDLNGSDIVTTSNATLDLAPNGTGTVVVRGNTNSGAIVLNCESNSHGQKLYAQPHSAAVTNTLMLPAGANSTLVSLVSTDTLTNKTINASNNTLSNIPMSATSFSAGTGVSLSTNTLNVDAAQTGITSVYATDLILGEDSQTAIDFGTPNEIDFKADNAARLTLTASALYPVTNNQIDLGTASLEFKDAFFDGTVTADAFAGPLTGNVTGNASGTAATVTGAAQSNITSLGTLTTLTVDNVIINGATIGHTGDTDLMTLASGVLTVAGAVKPLTYQETYVAVGAAATITCDLATGTSFSTTMDENTTFAFSNPPGSGTAFSFTLIVTQHSTAVTITWPGSVDWAGGSAPDVAGNNEVQAYAFLTRDGGTTYYGFLGGTAIG